PRGPGRSSVGGLSPTAPAYFADEEAAERVHLDALPREHAGRGVELSHDRRTGEAVSGAQARALVDRAAHRLAVLAETGLTLADARVLDGTVRDRDARERDRDDAADRRHAVAHDLYRAIGRGVPELPFVLRVERGADRARVDRAGLDRGRELVALAELAHAAAATELDRL